MDEIAWGCVAFVALAASTAIAAPQGLHVTGRALAEPNVPGLGIQAAKLALAGKFEEAGAAAARSNDAAAIKLVELIYLRDRPNEAGYARIMDFLNAAPTWPLTDSLGKRAERSLYVNNEPANLILSHFAKRQPAIFLGASVALGFALARIGKTAIEEAAPATSADASPQPFEGVNTPYPTSTGI
mgnify:CR=1 FL=1